MVAAASVEVSCHWALWYCDAWLRKMVLDQEIVNVAVADTSCEFQSSETLKARVEEVRHTSVIPTLKSLTDIDVGEITTHDPLKDWITNYASLWTYGHEQFLDTTDVSLR